MKTRQTKKYIERLGLTIYAVAYCEISNLKLQYAIDEPFAYNTGIYGWNWDAYRIGDAIFIDGYRNYPRYKDILSSEEVLEYVKKHCKKR